ncbi:MAG TPA: transglutaminase domain-containing protein [Thermoanaerobaculia bacterium]|nr:transglutaminase domain-containing protein [Thermoanaerobaculia bacterium]
MSAKTQKSFIVMLLAALTLPLSASPSQRSFEATYTAAVSEIPAGTKQLKVWLPLPVSREHQQVSDVRIAGSPFRWVRHTDALGNHYATTTIRNPKDRELEVKVEFRATRSEALFDALRPVRMTKSELVRDLKANRLVTLSPRVRALSEEVTAGATGTVAKARAIYDHLLATMKYDKTTPGWGRGDTERACDVRTGNCTDFHSLFMSLARAQEIPVRFVIGFPLTNEATGQIKGYHCWAEFHDEARGWIPADVSDASKSQDPARRSYLFGNLDDDRIEFTMGRDLVLTPRTKEPLNFLIYPYVEADGVAVGKPSIMLDFKDAKKSTAGASITLIK